MKPINLVMSIAQYYKNREKRRQLAHVIASLLIFFHAYERYEHRSGSYGVFAIAGIVCLVTAILHPVIEKRAPWIDGSFLTIEGLLSFVIAADFFHLGKRALPVAYICVGIFQVLMAFRKGRKGIRAHQQKSIVR